MSVYWKVYWRESYMAGFVNIVDIRADTPKVYYKSFFY